MNIPIFQVDAFTSRVFAGNPAAVCLLQKWLDDEILQAIAMENNLSETAFLVGGGEEFELRWFTPTTEVDLCGHATLASAFVIWSFGGSSGKVLTFNTKSGLLSVSREGELISMSFPLLPPEKSEGPPELAEALGVPPQEILRAGKPGGAGNFLCVYGLEEEVRSLDPDFHLLGQIKNMGVIVTAPGDTADFVSRYFAPAFGIPEDPVTGSSHCTLIPYWSERTGKEELQALQVSQRGGELFCRAHPDIVVIAGRAISYLQGMIQLPEV